MAENNSSCTQCGHYNDSGYEMGNKSSICTTCQEENKEKREQWSDRQEARSKRAPTFWEVLFGQDDS